MREASCRVGAGCPLHALHTSSYSWHTGSADSVARSGCQARRLGTMSDIATIEALRQTLLRIDGKGYKAYRDIGETYQFKGFTLAVDSVQPDPFAAPSRLRVRLQPSVAELPERLYANESRSIGVSCYLAREFARHASNLSSRRGSGRSGEIRIEAPGQQVLANSAVQIHDDGTVEARFTVGLPAQGRRVLGRQACNLLLEDLPRIIADSLHARSHPADDLWRHAAVNEDADALRAMLARSRADRLRRQRRDPAPLQRRRRPPFA